MRYVYAIIALVLAGVLLVLGVGQQTFLSGPDAIVKDAPQVGDSTYAVITAETLDQVVGRPVIELRGTDPFAAVGALSDIEAWLAPFDHVLLTVDEAGTGLAATEVPGELPTAQDPAAAAEDATAEEDAAAQETAKEEAAAIAKPIDPRGSDLWVDERSDSESVSLPIALLPDQGVLVATNGTDALPNEVSVNWMQSQRAPLAGPFLVAGVVFGLAGGIMYLLAVDHDRRGLGPRRGRGGPLRGLRDLFRRSGGSKTRRSTAGTAMPVPVAPDAATPEDATTQTAMPEAVAPDQAKPEQSRMHRPTRWFAALGLVGALGLTGCSANYWPDFGSNTDTASSDATPTPTESAIDDAPVPVTDEQISRILSDVADVANTADNDLDADLLAQRFTGDALAQRTANYKIRGAVADYQAPPRISNTRLEYELVQSTDDWPRTLFVVVESSASDETDAEASPTQSSEEEAPTTPSLALVLTQDGPHENFLVSHVAEVHGGITMPAAAPASEGTALLAGDLKTLRLAPDQVAAAYADLLQTGEGSSFAEDFDLTDDVLLQKMGLAWANAAQEEANAAGQKVQHSAVVAAASSAPVSLSTGEGGALVSVVINDDLISTSSDPLSKVKPTPSVTALSGITDSQDRIVQHWTHQMLFFVPSADSGELIRVLGSTSAMIGAGS